MLRSLFSVVAGGTKAQVPLAGHEFGLLKVLNFFFKKGLEKLKILEILKILII